MKNREQMSGYTGGLLESEVFGETEINEIEKALKSLKLNPENLEEYRKNGYLDYVNSIRFTKLVQKKYPDDEEVGPSNPKERFANDIHATLMEELGIEDSEEVLFYSSVKTPLDLKHGVDAFFEIKKKEGDSFLITMDVSMKDKEFQKANVLVIMKDGAPDPSEKDYEENLKDIANALKSVFDSGDRFKKVKVFV